MYEMIYENELKDKGKKTPQGNIYEMTHERKLKIKKKKLVRKIYV